MKCRIVVVFALLLAGCAAKLVSDDFAGPTALVKDSYSNFVRGGLFKSDKADFFVMTRADGKKIEDAVTWTAMVSDGMGFSMKPQNHERRVPIKPMKVDLLGLVYYPAPISGLLNPTYETRRTVQFQPVAGQTYVVRGRLGKAGSSVWIETAGGQRVTQ
jgi:hypothetical protein